VSVTQQPTGAVAGGRRPRIAYLSYSSGAFDARTARMARSALAAGFEVVVYARLQDGLPAVEEREGYRILRAPWSWWMAVPGLRRLLRGRQARRRRGRNPSDARPPATGVAPVPGRAAPRRRTLKTTVLRATGPLGATLRVLLMFPIKPLGWSYGLRDIVEPADIWHGMWAGSLPALAHCSRTLGGRAIYDSRDVYLESRLFATAGRPVRAVLALVERRWARRADRVLTVNQAYADLIAGLLGVPRPRVVMNCPERWLPPEPAPDRIREALGLPAATAIVLYQGQLLSERGIEQAMEAILEVPRAVLVLLGFGPLEGEFRTRARSPRYAGRVFLLPPVAPDELLAWTASADVSVMPILPTSLNHRHTTPQKLFESLAAGVPVVASDLPGMAEVVRATGAGLLCDPLAPSSIAAAIRRIVEAPPVERQALRARVLAAAHETYNWEAQVGTLLAVYRELLAGSATPGAA
jgi:glycosyltransferase involved in cell wall biosynthesis